jgi:Holliday junction DNA helicase RuvA
MIAKLTGKLDSRFDTSVVIDVNGVGYVLLCSQNTLRELPPERNSCVLFVEPLIRAENITLFGFFTEAERSVFRLLLTVQGVGGKVCLAILSILTPSQIQNSILSQDYVPFTQADGVGPKVAQRIVRELKDKFNLVIGINSLASQPSSSAPSSLQQEAVSALINLGYKKQEALETVYRIIESTSEPLSLNQIIPLALKQLAGA